MDVCGSVVVIYIHVHAIQIVTTCYSMILSFIPEIYNPIHNSRSVDCESSQSHHNVEHFLVLLVIVLVLSTPCYYLAELEASGVPGCTIRVAVALQSHCPRNQQGHDLHLHLQAIFILVLWGQRFSITLPRELQVANSSSAWRTQTKLVFHRNLSRLHSDWRAKKRTVPDAEERLFQDLKWAGLNWDEGTW